MTMLQLNAVNRFYRTASTILLSLSVLDLLYIVCKSRKETILGIVL